MHIQASLRRIVVFLTVCLTVSFMSGGDQDTVASKRAYAENRILLQPILDIDVVSAATATPHSDKVGVDLTSGFEDFGPIGNELGWQLRGSRVQWIKDGISVPEVIAVPEPQSDEARAAYFLDRENGWIVSFNRGGVGLASHLATTQDGGLTWKTTTIKLDGKVAALGLGIAGVQLNRLSQSIGWISIVHQSSSAFSLGTLLRTVDGGESWSSAQLPVAGEVTFVDAKRGLLWGGHSGAEVFATTDGGASWYPWIVNGLEEQIALVGHAQLLGQLTDRGWSHIRFAPESKSAPITWSAKSEGNCSLKENCTITRTLAMSWLDQGAIAYHIKPLATSISAKAIAADVQAVAAPTEPPTGHELAQVQGFDKCEVPSISQLQTWWNSSPYRVVNLYGGPVRSCANSSLNQSYVQQLSSQGWRFIPTWVGPQSQCWGGSSSNRISNDSATAYAQGVGEANAASDWANSLGLTNGGAVIYYDLEGHSGSSTCQLAAQSFISGWSGQIRQRGNVAGVYGSACSAYIAQFASVGNPVDVVWPAAWFYSSGNGGYVANASVFSVSCISNSLWSNHQRIRQYNGGNWETYGGVSLNIDENVLDGLVSVQSGTGGGTTCSDNQPSGDQVTLYVEANYCGTAKVLSTGSWGDMGALGFPDNAVSSVRVGANVKAVLCQNTNYGGCEEFTSSDPDLSNNGVGNETVSSVRVESRVSTPRPSANFDAWPQNGSAPLVVAMHIVDTSNMTSCSWNYGDGQTGNSCSAYHNHTYNNPGTYGVSLSVSGPGGSDSMSRSGYIVVSGGQTTPVGPAGYTYCASEGGYCGVSGTMDVAYGANGSFAYRYRMTGGTSCTNGVFGDPLRGVGKACFIRDSASGELAGYSYCSNEWGRCSFSGKRDIAYGANARFTYRYGVPDGVNCNNGVFGDPISGVGKSCYVSASSSGGPAGFTFCASEWWWCAFGNSKDVAYGANGYFKYRTAVTGFMDCNNGVFGDPIVGVGKSCYAMDSNGGGPAGYTLCSSEWGRCAFSGTKRVAYGANGIFYYRSNVTGGIDCNNGWFGDPVPGVGKKCFIQ